MSWQSFSSCINSKQKQKCKLAHLSSKSNAWSGSKSRCKRSSFVLKLANTDEVMATVDRLSLSSFADRVAAIDSRFDAVLVAAAELMEPKAQFVKLPSRTIKSDADIIAWLNDARETIEQGLKNGPVILH